MAGQEKAKSSSLTTASVNPGLPKIEEWKEKRGGGLVRWRKGRYADRWRSALEVIAGDGRGRQEGKKEEESGLKSARLETSKRERVLKEEQRVVIPEREEIRKTRQQEKR